MEAEATSETMAMEAGTGEVAKSMEATARDWVDLGVGRGQMPWTMLRCSTRFTLETFPTFGISGHSSVWKVSGVESKVGLISFQLVVY
jgi:hypothetical protein